jgi:DNA-binding NtrC family response regulator
MDCTATPESLIESTLFGSTKGAFTGSVERKGLLQAADGGSLLLDEVGEIASDIQPKLLRCLESKRFRPVGSTKECTSDFRIICSTNRDLLTETKKGIFRSDLYYRISAIRIQVPPLRNRLADIPVLANHFLQEISKDNDREALTFSPEALHALSTYDWPGNIRQLKFVIEASFFRAEEQQIGLDHLQLDGYDSSPKEPSPVRMQPQLDKDFKTFRDEAILEAERMYLAALLDKNDGDVRSSAQQAGLTREALYRVMSRCGISPNQFRAKSKK